MLKRCFFFTAMALCSLNVHGAENADIQCNYAGTQQELNACALDDYKNEDNLLNEKYKKVMQSLPKKQQDQLRKSNAYGLNNAIPYADKKPRKNERGSIWPLMFYSCLSSSTKQRTEALGK